MLLLLPSTNMVLNTIQNFTVYFLSEDVMVHSFSILIDVLCIHFRASPLKKPLATTFIALLLQVVRLEVSDFYAIMSSTFCSVDYKGNNIFG